MIFFVFLSSFNCISDLLNLLEICTFVYIFHNYTNILRCTIKCCEILGYQDSAVKFIRALVKAESNTVKELQENAVTRIMPEVT